MAFSGRKVLDGTVVSAKMPKTVVVSVERSFRHPRYQKIVRTRKKYLAHDADEVCREGDVVRIRESRPLSRRKRWRVIQVLRHSSPLT